ncbi:MAG: GtrA family protein [Anaerovoracaceae bacterium]|jgi:putative flippase GtrA
MEGKRANRIIRLIKQFIRFTGVGLTCFAIDYGIMILLTEAFGLKYLWSTGISFTIATVINYFLSSRFVFNHQNGGRLDLIIFVVLGAVGLVLNQLLMWLFVEHVGIPYYFTKIISGILVSFYNFATRKLFLERGKRKAQRRINEHKAQE